MLHYYINPFYFISLAALSHHFPFFRVRTHSLSKYSTCPFIERKSSSAQAAISFQSAGDNRNTICFLVFSFYFSAFSFRRISSSMDLSFSRRFCSCSSFLLISSATSAPNPLPVLQDHSTNRCCRCLRLAVLPYRRRGQPADWTPWLPSFHHPI